MISHWPAWVSPQPSLPDALYAVDVDAGDRTYFTFFAVRALAGGERLGDRRAERRIFRRHRAGEERDDAALFVDEVFAEIPGRQVARLAEEAVDRGLVRAFPGDHLLEHRERHVIGQPAE